MMNRVWLGVGDESHNACSSSALYCGPRAQGSDAAAHAQQALKQGATVLAEKAKEATVNVAHTVRAQDPSSSSSDLSSSSCLARRRLLRCRRTVYSRTVKNGPAVLSGAHQVGGGQNLAHGGGNQAS